MACEETNDVPERHPVLADILERNIRMVFVHREERSGRRPLEQRLADAITDFSGSMVFRFHSRKPFEPHPFGLLTMIVWLEAIFPSTPVLI